MGSDGATRRYTVGSLTNGTAYTFAVRGLITGSDPVVSNAVSATPEGVQLSAVGGDGEVALSWVYTGSEVVTGWEVRRSSDGGSTWSPDWTAVLGSDGATRRYTVGSLTNGTAYTFAVRGLITGSDPVVSNAVSATPEGVELSAVGGDGEVALSWVYTGSEVVTGWEVRRSSDGGSTWSPDWTAVLGSDGATRRYTVGSLTNGTAYTFAVRGLITGSDPVVSNAVSATPEGVGVVGGRGRWRGGVELGVYGQRGGDGLGGTP